MNKIKKLSVLLIIILIVGLLSGCKFNLFFQGEGGCSRECGEIVNMSLRIRGFRAHRNYDRRVYIVIEHNEYDESWIIEKDKEGNNLEVKKMMIRVMKKKKFKCYKGSRLKAKIVDYVSGDTVMKGYISLDEEVSSGSVYDDGDRIYYDLSFY